MHLEMLAQNVVRNAGGQRFRADEYVTLLVDSLPHWLHHLWQIPPGTRAPILNDPYSSGARSIQIASIERGLRDLWHSVVWEGHELSAHNGEFVIRPRDRKLAEKWLVWYLRDSANMFSEAMLDAAVAKVAGGRLPPVVPAIERTVTKIERLNGRKRRLVVGRANGLSEKQRRHVSEIDMLKRLYVGLFLDMPLPRFGALGLTCGDLCRAWWVIGDLVELMIDEVGDRRIWHT